MAQMRSIRTHTLSIGKQPDMLPNNLIVTKRRPTMGATLNEKVFQRSILWGHKEQLARVGIIKIDLSLLRFLGILDELGLFKISAVDQRNTLLKVMLVK